MYIIKVRGEQKYLNERNEFTSKREDAIRFTVEQAHTYVEHCPIAVDIERG